ncbi:MBL fold metallo-hydrolase [Pseudarthrobacter niigatensis]|uniref:Glyoxylase-like metal-dependent hydrolase (Beta-lactamase superfamily II) n=1 Tax=Pseudarthrobacter niigatensis TaxID=369935 RepID=A0AAJ1SUU4_9MICC|nr:glyoxylase-like metal-dependent hydrolase (beta-lactamase superfamily II) [Pseudarthrobacter niigatensis]MDQ0264235.1 glyoxylase-like metal-dependent hydrolase (beta-lactamase superfamily II) [Pseudarthrobacter niigatensis]
MAENELGGPFADHHTEVVPVIQHLQLPEGIVGPFVLDLEVRCFLVRGSTGLVLVDAGPEGGAPEIGQALGRVGATWSDITDVILTHSHADHVGGLDQVASKAQRATFWAGAPDIGDILSKAPLRPASEGDYVRGLRVLQTPGHTKGHISLLHEEERILFVGDAVGTVTGTMARAPSQFTADATRAEVSLRRLSELQPARMLFSHGPEVPDPVGQLRELLATTSGD